MMHYVGYGFDVNEIPKETWLAIVKKFDKELYSRILEQIKEDNCKPENIVIEFIQDYNTTSEYLRDIINQEEYEQRKKAGINNNENFVECYDNFLVFESIRFSDESFRAKYIRSEADFIRLIGKYINTESIQFGNIWEGGDWIEPCYYMD